MSKDKIFIGIKQISFFFAMFVKEVRNNLIRKSNLDICKSSAKTFLLEKIPSIQYLFSFSLLAAKSYSDFKYIIFSNTNMNCTVIRSTFGAPDLSFFLKE